MTERPVRFRHLVSFFFLFNGRSLSVVRVQKLIGQALLHRFPFSSARLKRNAAIISIAFVISWMDPMLLIRRRICLSDAIKTLNLLNR